MKSSVEIRKMIAEKVAQVQAIVELATEESRELTAEESSTVDAIQGIDGKDGEIQALETKYERAVRFEARTKQIAAEIDFGPKPYERQPSDVVIKVPARAKNGHNLKAYENSHEGERLAYIAGQVVLGGILGRQSSLDFLANHGLIENAMSTNDGLKGGFLVPEEMSSAIIRLVMLAAYFLGSLDCFRWAAKWR